MSDIQVKLATIQAVEKHPNADKLDVVNIDGWVVIVGRDQFKVGDTAVFIPIDAVLSEELELLIFSDSKIKLNKRRVRTIKIRGCVSQGLLVDLTKLKSKYILFTEGSLANVDLAADLGITKYEPPLPAYQQSAPGEKKQKRKENPLFHQYTHLSHFKYYPNSLQEGEPVVMTEKVHGCLQANTAILLADGTSKTIREIVDTKWAGEVMCLGDDGTPAITKVTNWFNNGATRDWIQIRTTRDRMGRGNSFAAVTCTPQHRFWSPVFKKFVHAGELRPGDKVLAHRGDESIPWAQQQVLIGLMLGDGSYAQDGRLVSFGQCHENKDYFDFIRSSLTGWISPTIGRATSGYGTEMLRCTTRSSYTIKSLFESWITPTGKQIREILPLSPISLAFWYMGDGSLSHSDGQEDRATFATCGFDEISHDNLVFALQKIGITALHREHSGQRRIFLHADEAEKLFSMVAPYIPSGPMRRKLPDRYKSVGFVGEVIAASIEYKPVFVEQTVTEILPSPPGSRNLNKYDIETEAHNYIAQGVVVHNSNFRASLLPVSVDSFWKRVKKLFGLLPEYEFCYGSHRVQLQNKPGHKGYYKMNIYLEMVKGYAIETKLVPGETVFGEVYGDGIQKNYHYGCGPGERRLVIFDVKVNDRWLSHEELVRWCSYRGLPMVPILYEGPYSQEALDKATNGPSVLAPSQKVREGCVVRPVVERMGACGRLVLKSVSPAYLLDESNSDFH